MAVSTNGMSRPLRQMWRAGAGRDTQCGTLILMDFDFRDQKQGDHSLHCRAILFDMDGTLVDSTAIIDRMWTWWANRHSLPVEPILAFQAGRPNRETMHRFGSHLDIEKEFREFVKIEQTQTDGLALVPGADEAVKAAQAGAWAVVTSANRALAEARFRVLGLPIPDVFLTSDTITKGKPDPSGFLMAAERLGVKPKNCVVFEDSEPGIASGNNAGMSVIAVGNAGADANVAFRIRNFHDVAITRPDGEFCIRCRS